MNIKYKKIEAVKIWLKPKSIKNIYVFLGFAHFYQCFIQGFSKITTLLTLILKVISFLTGNDTHIIGTGSSIFLILKAKLAFLLLKQAFIETSTLHHFNSEVYIWVETNAFDYVISDILSQSIL